MTDDHAVAGGSLPAAPKRPRARTRRGGHRRRCGAVDGHQAPASGAACRSPFEGVGRGDRAGRRWWPCSPRVLAPAGSEGGQHHRPPEGHRRPRPPARHRRPGPRHPEPAGVGHAALARSPGWCRCWWPRSSASCWDSWPGLGGRRTNTIVMRILDVVLRLPGDPARHRHRHDPGLGLVELDHRPVGRAHPAGGPPGRVGDVGGCAASTSWSRPRRAGRGASRSPGAT